MLALLCVAQFVIVLDVTIVAIALPVMQTELGFSTAALGWVITAYTLTFGGCLLAAGRLADRYGRRRAFAAGLTVFTLASLACGAAPSGAALLAARAIQGLGAALVAPAALALLTTARPDGSARRRAVGWWTAAAAGGGAGGWVLGGVLSGLLDWRWVFFVNVPICAAAVVLAPRVLPRDERAPARQRLDVAGTLLATGGLAALVLALTLVPSHGLAAPGPLGALAAAAALLAGFARVEARAADPLLDRAVLRRTGVLEPNLVAVALTATTTPPMFLCTLHAQQVLGLEPAAAGLLFPPFNAAVVAGSLAGPLVVAAAGERRAMTGGLAGVAAGAVALLAIAPGAPALLSLVGGFALLGAGLGVASVASTARGMAAMPRADQGLASGLLSTSAQLGTVLGLAVVVPLAAARTEAAGGGAAGAVAGYELGFVASAAVALAAAALVGLRPRLAPRAVARCCANPRP